MSDPIDNIVWLDAGELRANDYNPNAVDRREERLLERSIYRTGWIQPILISRDHIIIDGFHRWSLAQRSTLLQERYAGKIPCAVLDVGPDEAMAITVRINRAKGTHVGILMHRLVSRLVHEYLWDPQQVAQEIGAEISEVEVLLKEDVFAAKNIPAWSYSKAWVPEVVVE